MIKVYGDKKSGNCYKVQLICELLSLEYQWVDIDILAKETQTQQFLALNPNAKIPLLQLSNDQTLSESNAIINYLAASSKLLPTDAFALAKVQQWQFFEQYSHEPYIAVARFINKYLNLPEARVQEFKDKQVGGHKALAVMEQQLSKSNYLAGHTLSTADISLYAYTHVADEGGFELTDYPYIQAWMKRIENTSGYFIMGNL